MNQLSEFLRFHYGEHFLILLHANLLLHVYTKKETAGNSCFNYKNIRFKVSTLELANITNTVSQDLANI